MIQQLFVSAFLFTIFAFTFYAVFRMYVSEKETKKSRTRIMVIFLCYIGAVAALTIIPLRASKTNLDNTHFNFVPLISSIRRHRLLEFVTDEYWIFNYYENLIGNIVMFIPFGIFLPLLFRKKLVQVALIAAASSCLIETIQYLNMSLGYYRYVDIDDVILNTFGAIIGYWIYKLLLNVGKHTRV